MNGARGTPWQQAGSLAKPFPLLLLNLSPMPHTEHSTIQHTAQPGSQPIYLTEIRKTSTGTHTHTNTHTHIHILKLIDSHTNTYTEMPSYLYTEIYTSTHTNRHTHTQKERKGATEYCLEFSH